MTGTATQRHCQSCNKNVHNFAAMTTKQIERTILAHGGHICARISRRPDGSIITNDPLSSPSQIAAALLLTASLTLSTRTFAQTQHSNNAVITGVVKDATGTPISGAKVELVGPEALVTSSVTDSQGKYQLESAPGNFTIKVAFPGFINEQLKVALNENAHIVEPFTLQVGMLGEIVVIDKRPWYKKATTKTMRFLRLSS